MVPNKFWGLETFWMKINKPGEGETVIQERRVYEWEQYSIGLLYIFTLYKFWNISDSSNKESLTFDFLGGNFLSYENGYCYENQSVILIVMGSQMNQQVWYILFPDRKTWKYF